MQAAVLAGGKGRRMGGAKPWRLLGGQSLLARVLGVAGQLSSSVTVVGLSRPDAAAELPVCAWLEDDRPGEGPLGGLDTALGALSSEWVMVLTVDHPLVQASVLSRLWELRRQPAILLRECPLTGFYHRACETRLGGYLGGGRRRALEFARELKPLWISPEEVSQQDPEGLSFFNLNTPQELERAEVCLRGLR